MSECSRYNIHPDEYENYIEQRQRDRSLQSLNRLKRAVKMAENSSGYVDPDFLQSLKDRIKESESNE